MLDINSNNKFSIVSIEKWEDYQLNEKDLNSKSNNKRTTSEHKQECKEIYSILFDKYKEQIEKENANQKIRIISDCKNCSDYSLLTLEEQEKLFYDLMSVEKKLK